MSLGRFRRSITLGSSLLAVVAVSACAGVSEESSRGRSSADRPPNLIVILADDQGYHDLGCQGSETIRTPRLDRMAAEGLRLTHFYAQAVCGPSRAALMTGCYPIRIAEPENLKNQHTVLHPREITIAEQLKTAGYTTALIGKWHLGGSMTSRNFDQRYRPELSPNAQGFDHFFGTPVFNGLTVHVEDTPQRWPLMRNQEVVEKAVQSWDTITEQYTVDALRFIRENAERPFFLFLAHNMPHIPVGASEGFKGESRYGPYGDAIEEIDASTGRILDELARLGLDRDTVVIYTSDNGPWIETTKGMRPDGEAFIPPEHSGTADPLRGFKMLSWDGGSRVPCIVWGPGRIRGGRVSSELASTLDLYPTLCSFAGVTPPSDRTLDGYDVRALLEGEERARSPREAYYYYVYTHLQAVRSGPWKLVRARPGYPPWTGWSGRFYGQGVASDELYHMVDDPGESKNRAQEHPEVVARLQGLIEQGRAELGDYDQVGAGARFFDHSARRPDVTRWSGYDESAPVGPLRFDFEGGVLHGWTVTQGADVQPVVDHSALPKHPDRPLHQQGQHHLSTLWDAAGAASDALLAELESPRFRLQGPRMSFLIGGGGSERTSVNLCTLAGEVVRRATGGECPEMSRVHWEVPEQVGEVLYLRLTDASTGRWGHVTLDDVSIEGRLIGDRAPR